MYGHARVSVNGQSVLAQAEALTAARAARVFKEVARGAKTDRAQLHWLLKQRDEGAVFLVTRLDRLARARHLESLLLFAAGEPDFVHCMTYEPTPRPRTTRLMLTVFGGLTEFERDLIRARTGKGREREPRPEVSTWAVARSVPVMSRRKREPGASRANRPPRLPEAITSTTARFKAFRMTAVILYRIDRDKRMRGYYRMDVQPDLFPDNA